MPANDQLNIVRKTAILCAVWLCVFAGLMPVAAQIKFYTYVNRQRIAETDVVQVKYIIEGAENIRQFRQPAFADFLVERAFDEPYIARQDPGDVQPQDSYAKVAILAPRRAGRFYIPGATAVINGKLMRSNPVAVQVGDQQYPPPPYPVQPDSLTVIDQSEIRPGETIAKKVRDNFFLLAETNKTTCYVGEPMMAVYKACSRLNSNSQVVKRPSFTGFSVIEMVDSYDARPTIERIHGKPFYVHLIRKVQLFPLQAGTYELDNAEVESTIHFVKAGSDADALGRLFNPSSNDQSRSVTHDLTLKTEPITITVKQLPDTGQPPDFSGAVGNFTLSAQTNQTTTTAGSQLNVQFVINGSGNFPLVTTPQVKWPQGVEVSNPVVKEKTDPYEFPLAGYKSFEYTVVPRDAGTLVIPAASFSYFDAQRKLYRTVKTAPINITVKKGTKETSRDNPQYVFNTRPSIPLHFYWFGLVVIVIAGWIVYQLFFNRTSVEEKPAEVEQPVTEAKIITTGDYFVIASLAIMKNDQKKFYTEVQRVLWELAAAKSSVSPSELNKRNVTYRLRQASVPEDVIHDLVQMIDECEWLLYTPGATEQDMDAVLSRAKVIFERLQKA